MAKIVFLGVPAHGHINPTLPVVVELKQRGHEVIYYNLKEFQTKIESSGGEFRPYPPLPTSGEVTSLLNDGNLARMVVLNLAFTEFVLPHILVELEREQPDVVVYDSLALWGMMAARRLRIPSISAITHFLFDSLDDIRPTWRDLLHFLRQTFPLVPELLRLRWRLTRQFGDVFPHDHILPVRGDRNLVFTSVALQPQTKMIDDTFRFVGPSINTSTRDVDFSFEHLTRRPLIYISLGTLNNRDTAFYRAAFAAFADHQGIFVLSVGQHVEIARLGEIPDNFIVRNYVPQLEVLQRSDLFITHGGMNSIHEGLYYGIPLVAVPHQLEQLLNSRVVVATGAGRMIGDRPPYGRVTANQLRQAADELLSHDGYRLAAQSIGETLRASGGYQCAVDEIEALVDS